MSQQCGQQCECYSRVCGFFSPVMNWNPGKLEEYKMRKYVNINEASKKIGLSAEMDKLRQEIEAMVNDFVIDMDELDVCTAVTTAEKCMLGVTV